MHSIVISLRKADGAKVGSMFLVPQWLHVIDIV